MRNIYPLLFSLLFFLSSMTLNAQSFDWAQSFGDSGNDQGHVICTDTSGNIFVAGKYQGTLSLGTSTTSTANPSIPEIFLAKFASDGTPIWVIGYTGPLPTSPQSANQEYPVELISDMAGNVYLYCTIDGFGTMGRPAIVKFDAAGNLVWELFRGGSGSYLALYEIRIVSNGDLIVLGMEYANGYKGYFSRISSTGSIVWDLENIDGDLSGMGIDKNDRIYISGAFTHQLVLPDQNSASALTLNATQGILDDDSFLACYDINGQLIWGINEDMPADDTKIHDEIDGHMYVAKEKLTFPYDSLFLSKYSVNGNLYWTRFLKPIAAYTNMFYDGAGHLVFSNRNNWFQEAALIHRWDTSGTFAGEFYVDNSVAHGICQGFGGTLLQTGYFKDTAIFQPDTLISIFGTEDVYLAQSEMCIFAPSDSTVVNALVCDGTAYEGYAASGTYTDHFMDQNGCDSLRVLHLSFANPITMNAAITPDNGANNGSVSLSVSGGFPPYTYAWSNGGSGSTQSNLPSGTYQVTITDPKGCSADSFFEVPLMISLFDQTIPEVSVTVSPNPGKVNSTIYLTIEGTKPAELLYAIHDALGNQVVEDHLKIGPGISVIALPTIEQSGIFFLRIVDGRGNQFVKKIILQ